MNPLIKKLDELAHSRYILIILFMAAVLTRLIGAQLGGTRSEDDDHWHLQIAQHVLAGEGFRLDTDYGPTYSFIQPGFAAVHVVFMTLFKNFYLPERVLLHLFSALAILAYFFMARRLFPPAIALMSTLILILYPPQWFWMTRLNPHSFATNMLIFAFLFFLVALERRSVFISFGIGLLWGALTLMRPEYEAGILCLAFACLFAQMRLGRKLSMAAALVVGFILFLTPWMIRNYKITQRLVVSTTHYGVNFWFVFNPDYHYSSTNPKSDPELEAALSAEPNEVKRADLWVAAAKKFIRENPKLAVERCVFNFLTYWRPWLSPKVTSLFENVVYVVSYAPIFICFLWGLFKIPWRDPRWIAIVSFLGYKMLAHVPFYMIVRFREATMPMMLLVATLPLVSLFKANNTSVHE